MTLENLTATLLLYSLAAGAVVNVWMFGSIFATARSRIEAVADKFPMLSRLLSCNHCLTYNVPIWLIILFEVPARLSPDWLAFGVRLPMIILAVGRLTWLLAERK